MPESNLLIKKGVDKNDVESLDISKLKTVKFVKFTRNIDNLSLYQLGYGENVVRIKRSINPVIERTKRKWGNKRRNSWEKVDDVPLEKRKIEKNQ